MARALRFASIATASLPSVELRACCPPSPCGAGAVRSFPIYRRDRAASCAPDAKKNGAELVVVETSLLRYCQPMLVVAMVVSAAIARIAAPRK